MPDVTRLLDAAAAGDRRAAAELLPLVYDELRKLAAARMPRRKRAQKHGGQYGSPWKGSRTRPNRTATS